MSKGALGFIEAVGLAAAIASADTAVKAADVQLIGREKSKGGGFITVKITGEISAVKAALMAAKATCERVNRVWAIDSIARPAEGINELFISKGIEPGAGKVGDMVQNHSLSLAAKKDLAVTPKKTSTLVNHREKPSVLVKKVETTSQVAKIKEEGTRNNEDKPETDISPVAKKTPSKPTRKQRRSGVKNKEVN